MTHPYRPIHSPALEPELTRPWYHCREYTPSRSLESHIAAFWTMDYRPVPENQLHRIIPDGCVDIVVDLLSPSSRKAAYIVGLATRSEVLEFSQARSLFGIRIYSESVRALFRFPLSAFREHRVYLEEIWGLEGLHWVEEIQAAQSNSDIIEVVERKIIRMLTRGDESTPSLVYESLMHIYDSKGSLSVGSLADKVHFSERHLRRAFDKELGLSPKEMLGIVRFQSILQEYSRGGHSSLSDLALKYGYYDQSHFANSFARYYGVPLKRLTGKG
jgi:AraC-type DNA-binding domain-containing proteins